MTLHSGDVNIDTVEVDPVFGTTGSFLTITLTVGSGGSDGGSGVSDHGALTGLADDDHTQYLNSTRLSAAVGALALGDFPAGLARDAEVTNAIADEATARDAAITAAVSALLAGAPGALDTLNELAAALGDDADFAATVTTALAGKQPIDADLTAIAALSTTAYGRSLLEAANAAGLRTLAGLVLGTDIYSKSAVDSGFATASAVTDHTGDATAAHAATAIAFTPAGTIAATTVQAAIEEVASEAGGGGASDLDDLTDVDTSTVAPGEGTQLYYKASSSLWQVVPFAGRPIDNVPASPDAFDYEFDTPGAATPSGYAWSNQGSATYREAGGVGQLYIPGQAYQLHDLVRNVPAGTAWQVTAKISASYGDGSVHVVQAGLVLADSSGTKRITMAKRGAYGDFTIGSHTNVSAFSAQLGSTIYMPETCYVRITKNSTTSYDVHASPDGVTWTAAVTAQNFTSHMATIDKIGFDIDPESTALHGRLLVHWIRKTA